MKLPIKPFRFAGAVYPLLAASVLSGCAAVGEVAYDGAVARERAQCDKLVAMSDRQACMQRVNAAVRQAADQKSGPGSAQK